jgi:PAS domain S-box-containing protein
MKRLIRVLHLEDSPRDAELIQQKLEIEGLACDIVLANGKEGFEAALARDVYDIILCDHNLPDYDGRSALALAREKLPGVPVISLSGTLGEEEAVECLKRGATDYVLKHRLERLVPAVSRALQEAKERRARLQAEAALRESEEQFRAMFDVASIGMASAHPRSGQFLRVNKKMCAISGYSAAELLKMQVSELTHPDDRQKDWELFERVVRGEIPDYCLEKRYVRKDGAVSWVNVNMTVIRDAAGQSRRTMAAIEDITKRKQAEEALWQKEEYFRALTEGATDVTTLLDADGTMRYQSPSLEQVLGYTPEELVGRSAFEFIHPDDQARVQQALAELTATPRATTRIEFRLRHKDNSWHVLEATTRNLLHDPNVKGVVANSRDNTERKRAEAALQRAKDFVENLIQTANVIFLQLDVAGNVQRFNKAAEDISGYTRSEVEGKHWSLLVPQERYANVWEEFSRITLRGGVPGVFENPIVTKHDEDRQILWKNSVVREGDDIVGTISFGIDITERKRAEESQARLVTAVEQSIDTIVITDANGTILYANPAFEKTSGYTRKEAVGQNPRILKSGRHDAEFYHQIWAVLGRGEVWSGRLINKKKDGTLYEEDATISPVRDAAGKVVNYVAVKRDITHEAQLEAQLRQSQKMDAVGQLAGGVAHDFNNMLAIIRGNAELLLMDEAQFSAEAKVGLEHVVEASERAANLTRQLLAFSRKQVLQPQPLVLNEVIANLTKMLKRVIGENIDLQCHYAALLPYVQADTGMMEQVILNLVVNARDAMPQGGQLRVTTEQTRLDEAHARLNPEARAGEFVCLGVSDTGTGIALDVLPRLFEPFFTTKEVGKGTGLGLATVYGIVKQHQGWIEVFSQVGEGSTFKVFLPSVPTPARLAAATDTELEVRGGTEVILLVEDDHAVRSTARRVLERKGYTIREATNGREALEQWHRHAGEIALLLTDILMPEEMTGRDLAQRLLEQMPGLKVIFMSGYSADLMGKNTDFIRKSRSRFLQKPCSSRTLLETVRRCLDEKD